MAMFALDPTDIELHVVSFVEGSVCSRGRTGVSVQNWKWQEGEGK